MAVLESRSLRETCQNLDYNMIALLLYMFGCRFLAAEANFTRMSTNSAIFVN